MALEAPDQDVANTVISPKDKYSAKVPDDAISFLPTMVANHSRISSLFGSGVPIFTV